MDIATGAALIIMGITSIVGCVWILRREQTEEEQYISFEI
jgi:hypothetical protein